MPLFIDVHETVDDLTAEAIAGAHQHDPQAQYQHSVKFLKYWVDEASGKVCCLIEACCQEAAEAFHRAAHGSVAMVQIRPRQFDRSTTGGCKKAWKPPDGSSRHLGHPCKRSVFAAAAGLFWWIPAPVYF